MKLQYKPDFSDARCYWESFWQGEVIDRPCIAVTAPREGMRCVPHPPYLTGADGRYADAAGQAEEWISATFFGAEAIPFFVPSFGPDQFGAFLGGGLDASRKEFGTTWAVPVVEDWNEWLPLSLNAGNRYWQAMLEFCGVLSELGRGKFLVGMLDLHSNLDGLASLRGVERLLIDLADQPETIDTAITSVRSLYEPVYEGLYQAGNMAEWGSIGWAPFYCPGRFAMIQCDEIGLISPQMARRFVLPAVEEEAAYLDHTAYHLDGPDALIHLDDILAIPGIDVIQWVPGDGQPPQSKWMDLLKRIQKSGKGLHIVCSPEEVEVFHKALRPEKVLYDVTAASQRDAERLVDWLESNT